MTENQILVQLEDELKNTEKHLCGIKDALVEIKKRKITLKGYPTKLKKFSDELCELCNKYGKGFTIEINGGCGSCETPRYYITGTIYSE